MWTFHGFPFDRANSQLKTSLDQAWLDRVRLATVRLSGCTGSFVSERRTDPHQSPLRGVVPRANSRARTRASSTDGYLAKTARAGDALPDAGRRRAHRHGGHHREGRPRPPRARTRPPPTRRARPTLTQLEQQCETATRLKCQSVSLYEGGQYWLYKYKRYTDLRLVFAPEAGIASFGGDPDNFQFPRWCLDMSILRAYENGVPAKPANYLKVNFAGPAAGEPVFVSGHPGTTERLLTLSQLKQRRNQDLPQWLLRYSEIRGRLIQFAETSPENERIIGRPAQQRRELDQGAPQDARRAARRQPAGAQGGRGSCAAQERGEEREAQARAPAIRGATSTPRWPPSAACSCLTPYLENCRRLPGPPGGSRDARWCAAPPSATSPMTRASANSPMRRCRASSSSWAPRCRCIRSSKSLRLGNSLRAHARMAGARSSRGAQAAVEGIAGRTRAARVTGSKLADPAVRMALWKGGSAAVAASNDPMIELWRSVDAEARAVRKAYEDGVEAPLRNATERIARARFAVAGHQRVSRRHVHAAPQLRHRAGLERERHAGRAVHATCRAPSSAPRAPTRSAFPTAGCASRTSST